MIKGYLLNERVNEQKMKEKRRKGKEKKEGRMKKYRKEGKRMDGFGMFGSYKMEMVLGIILHYGH